MTERHVLAIETATSRATLALATLAGELRGVDAWEAGHRHAEELLARLAALLAGAGIARPGSARRDSDRLAGIIVGTGPGGFTGLRVGLATARGIARAAGAPLVGIPTGTALDAAARAGGAVGPAEPAAVLLPAGSAGRYLVRDGVARLAPARAAASAAADDRDDGGDAADLADLAPGATLVAVDLAGRAPAAALVRGAIALDGLAAALVALGTARLRAGEDDGPAVGPEYVTMPRGVLAAAGEVAWSPARP